jgi:maltose alpha-D-glucosyltransferase / alpha-amylase
VLDQRRDPDSLLSWFQRMLGTLRECSEVGIENHRSANGPASSWPADR